MQPREILRSGLSQLLVKGGFTTLNRTVAPKNGTIILVGHRLTPDNEGYLPGLSPEWFDEQLAYICRHYEVISLSTLVSCLEKKQAPPKNSLVITFDDGFGDNFDYGFPLLKKYGVPATIFIVTGCMDSGELPWPQRVGYILQKTTKEALQLVSISANPLTLATEAQRYKANLAALRALQKLPRQKREEEISVMARQLQVQPPSRRMLNWSQCQEMLKAGIEIGGHTYSHSWLAQVTLAEAQSELGRCLADLKQHLGLDRPTFCFPAGSRNAGLVSLVEKAGFRSAFQSDGLQWRNHPETVNPFSMVRKGLPNSPGYILEAELDGPFTMIRSFTRKFGK